MTTDAIIKPMANDLARLRAESETISVVDQVSYVTACQLTLACRNYVKTVGHTLDPGIESAKQHLDFLRSEKTKLTAPALTIVDIVSRKAEAWKADERRKAELEQQRINEANRKAAQAKAAEELRAAQAKAEEERKQRDKQIAQAQKKGMLSKTAAEKLLKESGGLEQAAKSRAAYESDQTAKDVLTVQVAAAVPKVAGIKARVNWKFRIVDAKQVTRDYLSPDEVKIGAKVREIKNKAEAEAAIGGIEVYTEDSI